MKQLYFLIFFLFQFVISGQTQTVFSYNFQSNTGGWNPYGDIQISWISQGANTPGAAKVEVLSNDGNIAHRRFYSAYHSFSGYDNKMLLVKVYAKSPTLAKLRIKADLHNNGQYRSLKNDFTLTASYEKYILPVRIKPGDTDLRINLQIGSASGTYYFDDISFEYFPYELNDIQQFETQRTAEFYYVPNATQQALANHSTNIQINIDTSLVIAPVLNTQIGVNSNFRSRNSLVNRAHLYESFGAFRFPAGSGSDLYFWDGNVPSNINGYSGTASNFLDPEHYIQFINLTGGKASVVANYAYARMGETPDGTREARVSQAAGYAAGFVHKLNMELNGNVKYWEIGNESYGAWEPGYNVGGSIVTGKEYGEDFRVFVDSMKIVDPGIKIGAVLSHNLFNWNKEVLKEVENKADYLIFHHYFNNIHTADGTRSALQSTEDDILELLLFAKEYTSKAFGYYPVNMTEFNSQGYHTTTMANGLFITNLLATLIKNRVNLASIWVNEWGINNNESHGILAKNDPHQANYTARPSYIPFYYFPKYFGSQMVQAEVTGDTDIIAYASKFDSGETGIVVSNYSDTSKEFSINFAGTNNYDTVFWYEIYAHNINEGNTKFYVNTQTSSTSGGGPDDLDVVPPYRAGFQTNNSFTARPYSVNFISIGKLPVTAIVTQPVSRNLCENETAVFQINATGQNLTYQWYKDGIEIPGATSGTYQISNTSLAHAGNYTCTVTGDFGILTSNVAVLTVTPSTTILSQPTDLTLHLNETATFSVAATGINLSYQWQFNNQDITGATQNSYTINNVQESNAGTYKVIVSGDCGEITSDEATLDVLLDMEEWKNENIKIFPNPTKNIINIEVDKISNTEIYIYDVSGKLMLQQKIKAKKTPIDIQKWAQGMYIIQIHNEKKLLSVYVVKK